MSTILNRSIAPQARQVGTPKMVMPETVSFSNGIKVHFLSSGTQEVTKLELLFQTGTISYPHPLVPGMAVSMLKEGTSSFNATQIAEWVEIIAQLACILSTVFCLSFYLYYQK
jgi:hypothetical protein